MRYDKPITLYLIGKPGVGKYSIAKDLTEYGFLLCDNHLANNPIFSLLRYDGVGLVPDHAWDAIGRIRTSILTFLSYNRCDSIVLTNVLNDDQRDHDLYHEVMDMAQKRGSIFIPAVIEVTKEEHRRRIVSPQRLERYKTIDPHYVDDEVAALPISHPNLIILDTINRTISESVQLLLEKLH